MKAKVKCPICNAPTAIRVNRYREEKGIYLHKHLIEPGLICPGSFIKLE